MQSSLIGLKLSPLSIYFLSPPLMELSQIYPKLTQIYTMYCIKRKINIICMLGPHSKFGILGQARLGSSRASTICWQQQEWRKAKPISSKIIAAQGPVQPKSPHLWTNNISLCYFCVKVYKFHMINQFSQKYKIWFIESIQIVTLTYYDNKNGILLISTFNTT